MRDMTSTVEAAEALRAGGRLFEAKLACEEILRLAPQRQDALALHWDVCHELGENTAAVNALRAAIAAGGESAQLHYMLGCALQDAERAGEAIAAFEKALALDPGHAKAANNLGCLHEARGSLDEAVRSYDRALQANPGLANALFNRGNANRRLGRLQAAESDLRRAISIDAGHADWHSSLAESLLQGWRLDDAVAAQQRALALEPNSERAQFGLGNALKMLGRVDEAEACFRRAVEIRPDYAEARGNLLLCLHYRKGEDRDAVFREHLEWARLHASGLRDAYGYPGIDRSAGRRLNVGYLSPNLHRHSVASYFEPLLMAHDRARVRISCYSNVEHPDAVTQRLKSASDDWRDVRGLEAEAVARRIREDRIDILVDLAGHTGGGMPLVLARKPAPVQVTWLGYPNTTGLAEVDLRLTDAAADPPEDADRYCTETLARLPRGFHCYRPDPESPEPGELPARRNGRITFGCFNNLAKITPEMIAVWSRILSAVRESRLLLKSFGLGATSARERLTGFFRSHGVDAARLELCGPEDAVAGHLARYRDVDIALDTFPYHGTTTTCEALWMGVPVVTLVGRAHVARVGLSLLRQVGLPELAAADADAYVETTRALAMDRERLAALRRDLRQRMRESPLLDAAGFARAVESVYEGAWRRWLAARPESAENAAMATRLHIGGREKREGWKILSIQPGPDVDYVGDCTDLRRFADSSVEEIYASHVLEHLGYQTELPRALSELCRVLRPGGVARISVPDFSVLCRLYLDDRASAADRLHIMRMAFGGQMDAHDYHRVGLDYALLSEFLLRAGFSKVERVPAFGLFRDSSTTEMLGEKISLNVVAVK